ncbi:MAG TPA: GAF domain-containing protein, partial [Acidothermaceae bacterium]
MDGGLPVVGPTSLRLTEILKIQSSVAVPIFVDDVLWGSATIVSDRAKPLPRNTEPRMAEFAALASTSIASAQRRAEVQRLADEQAALRSVATLVATGAEPEQLWERVLADVGELCQANRAQLIRYEDSMTSLSALALWSADGPHEQFAERWPVNENTMSGRVAREQTVQRIEDWSSVGGGTAAAIRDRLPVSTSVMAPVFADGSLWGGIAVHSPTGEVLAADTERRVVAFAELVSTAIANATARTEVRRLVDEQATIRRIATLVAQQAPLRDVCQKVAEELGDLLRVEDVRLLRYGRNDDTTVLGSWGLLTERYTVGSTVVISGDVAVARVRSERTLIRLDGYDGLSGEPARLARGAGLTSTIACPIFVGDRLWGALTVASSQPGRILDRVTQLLSDCLDLIATAIRNAEAHESVRASRERIVTATDQARRGFERDLHDGAQQRLVALALELRACENLTAAALAATADEVDSILTDLRDLSRGLHPAVLSEGGLPAAVRSLARRCPTPVRLALPDSWPEVNEMVETACYYVVAEALTNVAKHAQARGVDVELTLNDTGVRIVVRDDGVGGASTADGSGLLGIADRVEALGGFMAVASPCEAGTTLV